MGPSDHPPRETDLRLRFGAFVFDAAARCLTKDGARLHLERRAFELLSLLLEQRPAVVPKAVIHDRLWPDTHVAESSLTTLAAQLRSALGPGFLRTVYGHGYAFDGSVAVAPAASRHGRPCLLWNRVAFPLLPGENWIGRGLDADVTIAAPGVSRRHAVLRVGERQASIEDAGSRNGTFVNHCPTHGPVALKDRDLLGLGTARLRFRLVEPDERTAGEDELRRR
jgi:DNA-binding winged helix-turn-helix (wHTH) protein